MMVEYGLRVVSAHDQLSQKVGVSILRRAVQSRGLGLGRSGTGDRDFMELLYGRVVAMLVCEYDLSMSVYWRVFGTLLRRA
jgi:hypothetical protein